MQREMILKIKDNSYPLNFPKQGTFLDIEKMKELLTDGMYGALRQAMTIDSEFALDLVDAQSYFTFLIPNNQLIKDLKYVSFRDLELEDAIVIRNAYVEQVVPFINGLRDMIREMTKKKEEEKKSE